LDILAHQEVVVDYSTYPPLVYVYNQLSPVTQFKVTALIPGEDSHAFRALDRFAYFPGDIASQEIILGCFNRNSLALFLDPVSHQKPWSVVNIVHMYTRTSCEGVPHFSTS